MWQQRACYEQSNVLDVTIQCQLNVSAKNVAEFTTMYGPQAGSHHTTQRNAGNCSQPSHNDVTPPSAFNHATATQDYGYYFDNVTPKRGYQCSYDMVSPYHYSGYNESRCVTKPINDYEHSSTAPKYGSSSDYGSNGNLSVGNSPSCMNDSGYGSPYSSLSTQRNGSAFTSCVPSASQNCSKYDQCDVTLLGNECDSMNKTTPLTYPSVDAVMDTRPTVNYSEDPTEDTKIAMREKDVMQRLFSLRTAEVDDACAVEQYYQSQSAVIDIERHNVLCQMAYDRKSSDSIHKYYNRKLLSLLECVEEKLVTLEGKAKKGGKRHLQTNAQAEKKSRLLPKHAIKVMEAWYRENLENPYPSRETTLSMAAEGAITVEQIRKWFANKRNRSRNAKLKASDVDGDE